MDINKLLKVCLLFFMVSVVYAQQDIEKLERLYHEDRLDELQSVLGDVSKAYPQHPTVLYLNGIFSQDADTAFHYFETIYNKYENSKFADRALFRMSQYYYAKNEFYRARLYFTRFLRLYPETGLRDEAQYLLCQSIYAQGKPDSARLFLQSFIRNVKASPYVDMAITDLETSQLWPSHTSAPGVNTPKPQPPKEKIFYSIQIGAFTMEANALRVKQKFEQESHYVEIREKTISGRVFYAVWVGRFDNMDAAKNYGKTFLDKYKIDYKVIERSK